MIYNNNKQNKNNLHKIIIIINKIFSNINQKVKL